MQLFKHDASYYAERIKQRKVSVLTLVERAIENIESLNDTLHAVTVLQAEMAREVAHQQDQQLAAMTEAEHQLLPVFFGVPILLKDLGQEQAGVRSTGGARLFKDYVAQQTDHFVQAIIDLGFVIVGRTSTPEFGFKNISDAEIHGKVNFPGDLQRNAGGSSGGAAAALKAGLVPIVTASDGGGSIRIPASFSGLIGLKPSRGRIPVGPTSYRGWQGASVNFALTKSMRDTWELLQGLQVAQYDAPFMVPLLPAVSLSEPERPLRIAYMNESVLAPAICDEAQQALAEAVTQLSRLGHELIEITALPEVDVIQAARDYCMMNSVETVAMMNQLSQSMQREIMMADMELISWGLYQAGTKTTAAEYAQLLTRWDLLAAQIERVFQSFDVILTPTTNGPAPLHTDFPLSDALAYQLSHQDTLSVEERTTLVFETFARGWSYTPYTFLQNLAGQPAISLPLFKTATGLPIGIQLWCGKGQELKLCQLAYQLEQQGLLDTQVVEVMKA